MKTAVAALAIGLFGVSCGGFEHRGIQVYAATGFKMTDVDSIEWWLLTKTAKGQTSTMACSCSAPGSPTGCVEAYAYALDAQDQRYALFASDPAAGAAGACTTPPCTPPGNAARWQPTTDPAQLLPPGANGPAPLMPQIAPVATPLVFVIGVRNKALALIGQGCMEMTLNPNTTVSGDIFLKSVVSGP